MGIDSHVVSRSGRLLTAPGADTVPGCTCNKGAVWYAPPTGTHATETATGMPCVGWISVHGADSAAGVAFCRGEPRKNTLLS